MDVAGGFGPVQPIFRHFGFIHGPFWASVALKPQQARGAKDLRLTFPRPVTGGGDNTWCAWLISGGEEYADNAPSTVLDGWLKAMAERGAKHELKPANLDKCAHSSILCGRIRRITACSPARVVDRSTAR